MCCFLLSLASSRPMSRAIWAMDAREAFTSTEFVRGSATAMTRACCKCAFTESRWLAEGFCCP